MNTDSKHAQVIRDGFRVPLIGIAPSAVIEVCDLCGNEMGLREMEFTGLQFLCCRCSAIRVHPCPSVVKQQTNEPNQ